MIEENTVYVYRHTDTYLKLVASRGILNELQEYFTFEVPGARFHPKVKAKMWDGKIRLLNTYSGEIYAGLYDSIKQFAADRDYAFVSDYTNKKAFSLDTLKALIDKLDLSREDEDGEILPLELRQDQFDTVAICLGDKRRLVLSAVSSGKSAMIYILSRILAMMGKRILIIVPTINLVTQLFKNFKEYSHYNKWDVDANVHMIYQGQEKFDVKKPIIISTWQSIYNLDHEWFDGFGVQIVDEAHEAKADSIKKISENLYNCTYKLGFTGTLTGSKTDKMVLEGLFGPVHQAITTSEMIEKGYAPNMVINCLVLKHKQEDCAWLHKYKPENKEKAEAGDKYKAEYEFLIGHEGRNRFIASLAGKLKRTVLLLFTRVEDHGDLLHAILKEVITDRDIYYIHGGIDGNKRDEILKNFAASHDAILEASYGTTHKGISVKNIFHLIMGSPYKSRTKILQSIGRGLRTHKDKDMLNVWDIVDDMTYTTKSGKQYHNNTYKQFLERLKTYQEEGFDIKFSTIDLENYNER